MGTVVWEAINRGLAPQRAVVRPAATDSSKRPTSRFSVAELKAELDELRGRRA